MRSETKSPPKADAPREHASGGNQKTLKMNLDLGEGLKVKEVTAFYNPKGYLRRILWVKVARGQKEDLLMPFNILKSDWDEYLSNLDAKETSCLKKITSSKVLDEIVNKLDKERRRK